MLPREEIDARSKSGQGSKHAGPMAEIASEQLALEYRLPLNRKPIISMSPHEISVDVCITRDNGSDRIESQEFIDHLQDLQRQIHGPPSLSEMHKSVCLYPGLHRLGTYTDYQIEALGTAN